VDFVVPLPEKVFLPAENFETLFLNLFNDIDFGFKRLSPFITKSKVLLRLFLTTGSAFKSRLAERTMGNKLVEEIYRYLRITMKSDTHSDLCRTPIR